MLLDDPISALDAAVKKKIFKHLFLEKLQNKTRILVTHAVDFLHLVDRILVIKEGKVQLDGSYEDLKQEDYLVQLIKIHKTNQTEANEVAELGKADADANAQDDNEESEEEKEEEKDHEHQTDGKLMEDENDEKIEVNYETYRNFFKEYYDGGWQILAVAVLTKGGESCLGMLNTYVQGDWT